MDAVLVETVPRTTGREALPVEDLGVGVGVHGVVDERVVGGGVVAFDVVGEEHDLGDVDQFVHQRRHVRLTDRSVRAEVYDDAVAQPVVRAEGRDRLDSVRELSALLGVDHVPDAVELAGGAEHHRVAERQVVDQGRCGARRGGCRRGGHGRNPFDGRRRCVGRRDIDRIDDRVAGHVAGRIAGAVAVRIVHDVTGHLRALVERLFDRVLLELGGDEAGTREDRQGDADERTDERWSPARPVARIARATDTDQDVRQSALADRCLDETVRDLGDDHRHDHRQHELVQDEFLACDVADDLVDRPVVEVKPVRACTDPEQDGSGERPGRDRAGMGDRGDDRERCDRRGQESALEEGPIGPVVVDESDRPHQVREGDHPGESCEVEGACLVAHRAAHHRDGTPDHRERRPEHQPAGPADRGEIQRVRLGDRSTGDAPEGLGCHLRSADRAPVVEHRDDHREADRADEEPLRGAGDLARATAQQHDHHQRPQQIELLLDREAPQVAQRGEVVGRRVAGARGDLIPVRDVEQSPDDVAAQLPERILFEERCPDAQEQQHHAERREEPPGAPDPELDQVHGSGALLLRDQQQRDQIPRDHEEHLDPEESALQPGAVGVVDHHRDDGERAHSVESGQIGDLADLIGLSCGRAGRVCGVDGHRFSHSRRRRVRGSPLSPSPPRAG